MTVFLDIVGSLMIRATMVVIVLSVNVTLNNAMYEKSARVVLKQNLTTLTDVMRSDIKNLGYNYTGGDKQPIRNVTYPAFYFRGDLDNDGAWERNRFVQGDDVRQHRLDDDVHESSEVGETHRADEERYPDVLPEP